MRKILFRPGGPLPEQGDDELSIRKLFKHTAIYGLGDVSRKLVGFVMIPIYTNYLSPSEYGEFQIGMMFISFVSIVYLLGINSAFFRFYLDQEDAHERRRIFTTSFLTVLTIDIVFSSILIIFRERISLLLFGTSESHFLVVLCVIALIAQSLETFPALILRAENRSTAYLLMVLAHLALTLGSSSYFIIKSDMGAVGALLGLVLGYLLVFFILLPIVWKGLLRSFSFELVKRLLSFGTPFIPSLLSLTIVNLSDQYIIRYFRGLEETGLYALSYKIGMAVNLFVIAFRMAWIPFMFQVSKAPDARERYAKVFTLFASFMVLVFFALCLYIDEVYSLVVDPQFHASKGLIPPIALSYVFFGFHTVFMVGLYLKNRTPLLPVICGASALLNIVSNVLLIPRYGMVMAAWTTLASFFLMAWLTYYYSNKLYPIPFRLDKAGVAILAAVVILWLKPEFSMLSLPAILLVKTILLVLVASSFIVLRLIPLKISDILVQRKADETTDDDEE